MLTFKYVAMDTNSKKITGIIEEESISGAAANLRKENLTILELKEKVKNKKNEKRNAFKKNIDINYILEKVSLVRIRHIIDFLGQLSSLTESGITMVQSLEILEEQITNKKLKKTIRDIKIDVENGTSLSDAIAKFPKIFNKMIINIIKTGEDTGLIYESLDQISLYLEEQSLLKKQVISSLIYPCIVLTVTLAVIVFMVLYVMPELIPFIEMTGGQIAWNTQILIDMTYFFQTNYKKISITIISLIVLTVLIYRTKKGKYYIDKIKIRLPLIGSIFLYSSIIKFTKTLSVLLDSGVSIVPALESTSNVVGNEIIKETILNMANSVLAGDSLSTPISNAKNIFPHIVENLIKIGEQTGSIHNSLLTLSEIFNKMFQERVKLINIIMEPLLMLFLGFIVAFVAGSLISGILSSYGQF